MISKGPRKRGPQPDGLRKALERLTDLHGVNVTVGLQGPEHIAPGDSPGTSVLLRAAVNEFGSEDGHIPPRPFLRTSLREHGKRWAGPMKAAVKAQSEGRSAMPYLIGAGTLATGDVHRVIIEYPWETNAESTVERKTRRGLKDQPLVDTGQMRQSIRASVDVPGRAPQVLDTGGGE